jgi:HSP20 family protein
LLIGIELDVKETETDYNLEADMPGLGKQDIKLKINNNLLLISAERKMDVID